MSLTRLQVLSAMLAAVCGVASAGTVTDPAMGMAAGSYSTGLSQFVSFTPNQTTGGGILDLNNDSGDVITGITFQTFIQEGLSLPEIDAAFTCNSASDVTLPNPFFLTCTISYNLNNGQLDFAFSGDSGIPPMALGCTDANADTPACTGQGHFAMTFNDGYLLTGDAGEWLGSDAVLFKGPPVITISDVTLQAAPGSVPEPSALLLALTGLFGLAAISRRR
jgi:hypothetical protein